MCRTMTSANQPAAPTTTEIRRAVAAVHHAVYDPDACPVTITAAHDTLVRASTTATAPVNDWIIAYLDKSTTSNGHRGVRDAVNRLAQNFKLPPERNAPPVGQQGTLFD
jgi:hypothetical protein